MSTRSEILARIYHDYNHPAGLGSINKLLKQARLLDPSFTRAEVKRFLETSDPYTLHYTSKKKYERLPILAAKPSLFISSDLGDLTSLAKFNNGYKYILIVIDIFSRLLQVRALKSKSGQEVSKALESIFNDPRTGRVRALHTDRGSEYYNNKVKSVLKRRGVKLYSTHSQEIKASHAERVLRTLKKIIYKYLTLKQTFKYIDVLQQLVSKYNNTPHRSLRKEQTPSHVHSLTKLGDIRKQFNLMYRHIKTRTITRKRHSFKPGDCVRIVDDSHSKPGFYKGFLPTFKEEYFTVKSVNETGRVPVYTLKDLNGEVIEGKFYGEELILVQQPTDGTYKFRTIRTKGTGDSKKYFVEWVGYPPSFNSWVSKTDLVSRNGA